MATDLYSPIATLLGPCIINLSTTATRVCARPWVHYTITAYLGPCIKNLSTTATRVYGRSWIHYTITAYLGSCIKNLSTTATRAYARPRVHYTIAAYLEFRIKWQSTTATRANARSCSQNSLAANLSTIVVASTTCTVETIGWIDSNINCVLECKKQYLLWATDEVKAQNSSARTTQTLLSVFSK